jgi:cation transport ATPase
MTEQTFSDPIAQGYYRQGESEIATTQSADEVLQKADALARQDSRANLMHAACYYLAAAHFLEPHDLAKSSHAYHQAGRQLQQLDQFIHAARAFSQAGAWAEQAASAEATGSTQQHLQHAAVRSYSRANHCFAEAGELDESESAYLKERDARVTWAKMQGKHPLALLAWKTTSNYGTSIPRWTAWILGTIMLFSLLYEVFFRVQWLQPMSNTNPSAWIPLWSGLYYAINVTSSLALVEYQPTHPIAQAIVMLNVIAGYLFLGIGIGIVGQFVKNR